MKRVFLFFAAAAALCCTAHGQYAPAAPAQTGVLGYWSTDAGSVLHIDRCDGHVCITIVTISKKAPGVTDERNPDASLRSRPICKMAIGTDFALQDPDHAVDGKIYDPESGKTYKAAMTSEGNALHLRGYIGIKMFGRTETWQRTTGQYATCEGTTRR
ncbi:DUF2147 domain-containing protein [Terriglobus aquaticus]|uniref:DUF2147 domain-containing protein n=1 Tax=Terriglobus aquaticus TaxID=940139 RepID=A0ABW9KI54_9BACT|nr:DUF2147 domain-containing protein [Terriglobus aquaticus]